MLSDILTRFYQWWCSHKVVSREWEWTATEPYWKERDVWSCMDCQKEIGYDPSVKHTRKKTYRPVMTDELWQVLQALKVNPEFADVRLRAVGRLAVTD